MTLRLDWPEESIQEPAGLFGFAGCQPVQCLLNVTDVPPAERHCGSHRQRLGDEARG